MTFRRIFFAVLFAWSLITIACWMLGISGCASAKALADLKAEVQALAAVQIGAGNNQVGGNQILDSKVALASVAGLVILSLGLALIYRHAAKRDSGVAGMLIRQLEARRDRKPCACGTCADCIVESLRNTHCKWAKALNKKVKRETG